MGINRVLTPNCKPLIKPLGFGGILFKSGNNTIATALVEFSGRINDKETLAQGLEQY
ncbi:hypothetical protein PHYBLDRAFT_152269 [Phycomyces blakesleeanus NRRL 1555(-)]|uniref:Uncharacterized protein n=1 Tax=Phycomyces blakesleeanus (strain ATCC 8743b / DSM 1359 / FGSC 10004 / NBRC 33097 / NRRL 1555) TaxID=763407 RepID=A0A162ZHB3_PHYB8|nr:hypothetical protein PHYBLDRAFT_152269 [Phycomyces blakesleeanus NRRL 1555(-)]OAD66721.1 hypothetical protein PHYBLDRAFT_152269 [Phycomyces blakesleeanus NRRL 1555(-)]|eukprot:XP_018284761.1 hypothetical protein PHYBLDRAFT_152269 [Phycomyces blakesleeanus NRRL 1555(-)]